MSKNWKYPKKAWVEFLKLRKNWVNNRLHSDSRLLHDHAAPHVVKIKLKTILLVAAPGSELGLVEGYWVCYVLLWALSALFSVLWKINCISLLSSFEEFSEFFFAQPVNNNKKFLLPTTSTKQHSRNSTQSFLHQLRFPSAGIFSCC